MAMFDARVSPSSEDRSVILCLEQLQAGDVLRQIAGEKPNGNANTGLAAQLQLCRRVVIQKLQRILRQWSPELEL